MAREDFSTHDEFLLEGAVAILQRYARHLQKNVRKVVVNYEATDFDEVQFLADAAYALDNADVVKVAAETIDNCVRKMRTEVRPEFENNTQNGAV